MRRVLVLSLLLASCARRSPAAAIDAGVTTTSAELDGGVVSAASALGGERVEERVRAVGDAGGPSRQVAIPAGAFASGSTPGDQGRQAAIEPALVDVELGAFTIDALPFPNEEGKAPVFVDSSAAAAELCASHGERLCTELEWEHACKGPNDDAFATGTKWDPECAVAPSRCTSGYGARAMGFLREWTDDKAFLRGGGAHRCAARTRLTSRAASASAGFRCCSGERNGAVITTPEAKPAFRRTTLEAGDLERIFADVPELSRIGTGIRTYSSADLDGIREVAGDVTLATAPILWSPEPGIELLVATGHAKRTAFIVALWTLPNDRYRFASSFLLLNEAAPVALAYEPSRRKELRWTSCGGGCAGSRDQGGITLHDDGRAVIVQY